jgi:glycosyltransferase involved in cell wall biosynthesis
MSSLNYDVVVPTKGNCGFVLECLSSIFNQSLKPTSVKLILDDGDPHFGALKNSIKTNFPTCEVVTSGGYGMIRALNYGITTGDSDFISFLDSDDLWVADKQILQIDALSKYKEFDVVTSNFTNFDLRETLTPRRDWFPSMTFTSATFRKSTFERFGLVDETATHFTWLYRWWAKAIQAGISRMELDVPGVVRRVHGSNSWILDMQRAHQYLFTELRKITADQRIV